MNALKNLILGTVFGFILMRAEVISWFRIQEMFRFHEFHMYGVIGSAIFVGIVAIQVIKKFKMKDIHGNPIVIEPKNTREIYSHTIGGFLFGLGWALTGACPGPMYALLGSGLPIFAVVIFCAVLGAYAYGVLEKKLPHEV